MRTPSSQRRHLARTAFVGAMVGLLLAVPLAAVVGAMPISDGDVDFPNARKVEKVIVGYAGDAPTTKGIEQLGGKIVKSSPELGFAVVSTPDASSFLAGLDQLPGVEWAERDAPVKFAGASWDGANWDAASWDGANWDAASWDAASWDAASWDGASWDGANWDGANWNGASWDGANWDSTSTDAASWNGANWNGASWNGNSADGSASGLAMDPGYPLQYGLGIINGPAAFASSIGTGARTVCVIDSGVDYTHPDLAANMWTSSTGTHGYDFVDGDEAPMDVGGHGTHVAGIIAAVAGNGEGIMGVSQAKIMAVRAIGAAGEGLESDVALGISWCVTHGAHVISMSLGTTVELEALKRATEFAHKNNVLMIASVGNEGCECRQFPAGYDNVVGVGAVDAAGRVLAFSNRGPTVDLTAPGFHIVSTLPGERYGVASGTSQATPFVAGAAALAWALAPGATADDVEKWMEDSARDQGQRGSDDDYGDGTLDLAALVARAVKEA